MNNDPDFAMATVGQGNKRLSMSSLTDIIYQKHHSEHSGLIFLSQNIQKAINQQIRRIKVNEENRNSSKLACYLPCYPLIPLNELRVTCSISMPPK